MKIDEFIRKSTTFSKVAEEMWISKQTDCYRILVAFHESQIGLAKAIKEENTNLLRAMPCGCAKGKRINQEGTGSEDFEFQCERCKQLEEREKE